LVFGARAAEAIVADALPLVTEDGSLKANAPLNRADLHLLEVHISHLQRSMWANAGLLRQAETMRQGQADLDEIETSIEHLQQRGKSGRRLSEAQAMVVVARAILRAAMAREESRGAHFRNDFPKRWDAQFQKHSVDRGGGIRFDAWD
jgi:L-aspartate oxidase